MGFNFKKFTATDTSFDAKATVRKTGQIGFTAGAINCYQIADFDFVILYYDPDCRVVGIELAKEYTKGAIPLKKSKVNTYVRAKNFCDCFGIDYSESRRFALKREKETGYLFFRLDESETEDGETPRHGAGTE